MTKLVALSTLAVLALAMLLPVANQVNLASTAYTPSAQGGRVPLPPGPGGLL
jgi:hypothetical protein